MGAPGMSDFGCSECSASVSTSSSSSGSGRKARPNAGRKYDHEGAETNESKTSETSLAMVILLPVAAVIGFVGVWTRMQRTQGVNAREWVAVEAGTEEGTEEQAREEMAVE